MGSYPFESGKCDALLFPNQSSKNTVPQGSHGVLALGMRPPCSEEAHGPHGEDLGSTTLVELPTESQCQLASPESETS